MTPADLTTLHHAEDTATAAQVRLAKLENLKRGVMEAMLVAGNAVLNSLSTEERIRVEFGIVSDGLPNLIGRAMEALVLEADDAANDAANFVHDLECEAVDAAHAERSMPAHSMAAE